MNVLFISRFGDSYGLATKIAAEGATVRYYIDDKRYADKGRGNETPERVRFYEPYVGAADVIVFDMSGLGALADRLKKRGRPVVGASALADRMEKDRSFAQELMKRYAPQVTVPEYRAFGSIREGVRFLAGEKRPFVFKPDNMAASKTFVPRKPGNSSVISVMELCPSDRIDFILQEKVEGIEVSTEGWFNGRDWVEGAFNHTLEKKRFMDSDKGPNTGCAGNTVWPCGADRLVRTLLLPFTGLLREHGYRGPLDVNAVVAPERVYFLEFTPRLGYDAIQAFSLLMRSASGFFKGVADGNMRAELTGGPSIAVRLTMPPYPLSEDKAGEAASTKGMKAVEVPRGLQQNVMMTDVMIEKGVAVCAGTDNVVGDVCATGATTDELRKRAYGIIDEIAITNDLQYRSDIGAGDGELMARLKEWGWA